MRTFIQLKNGVGFATIIVPTDSEPDHSVTPDDTTAIEVFTDNPDQFLKKQYNAETKSWTDAPLIRFAEVDENGTVIEIKKTYFEHEVTGPILGNDVVTNSTWVDGAWVPPRVVSPVPIPEEVVPSTDEIAESPNLE
jgi:hypothetical protein